MTAIDAYGELELPEEKEDIKIVEDKSKTKESEFELLIHKIMKKLTAGGNEDRIRAGFLIGKIEGDKIEIEDIEVPKQVPYGNIATVISWIYTAQITIETERSGKQIIGFAI